MAQADEYAHFEHIVVVSNHSYFASAATGMPFSRQIWADHGKTNQPTKEICQW
jgi:hypothetical protein